MKFQIIILMFVSISVSAEGYIILNKDDAISTLKQCSRYSPQSEGYWKPTDKQIKVLEENISELMGMESSECCSSGKIEYSFSEYARYYSGIIIKGEKLIYLNASGGSLRKKPMLICDGGKGFWGVIFNPKTNKFSKLAFNGAV